MNVSIRWGICLRKLVYLPPEFVNHASKSVEEDERRIHQKKTNPNGRRTQQSAPKRTDNKLIAFINTKSFIFIFTQSHSSKLIVLSKTY